MKKIITLLFFAGLVSTSFAQSGYRQKDNTKNNGNSYQSPRSGNSNFGDTRNSNHRGGGSNDQWNKRGNGDGYGHDGYSENWNRHNERGGRYGEHRGYRNESYRNGHKKIFFFRLFHHDRD
jgi:hypothetical protein